MAGRNLLTVADSAVKLGISEHAVRDAIRRKALKAERYGQRLLLIDEKDLDKYAERKTRLTHDPRPGWKRPKAKDESGA